MDVLGIINLHENEELIKEITLTRPLAAVPFGGRFRIIDFILSNMVNSGISNVGIVFSNKYRSLVDHLRSGGKEWDLARKRGGLFLLPPPDHVHYANSIYKGDLEHLYNQKDFLKRSSQKYVLIACSHILYNMNFGEAFQYHLDKQADITVLYKNEPQSPEKEFSRALVLSVAADGRVTDMKINSADTFGGQIGLEAFIMTKELLLRIIEECITRGEFDLIKEGIIKNMRRYRIYGYGFKGYIAKINSISSYYQANMDLLNPKIWHELFTESAPIYTKLKDEMPSNYRGQSVVNNSLIADGCIIEGRVENSILFRGVKIQKGARIRNSIIMQKSNIGINAVLENVICDKEVTITKNKRLNGDKNYVVVIEKGMVV